MNTYNFNDVNFKNSNLYKQYIADNAGEGYLKIRAYTASQALPISNLKIVVSKIIGNNNVIFFDGETNSSGVIEKIVLPAPARNSDDLVAPSSVAYDIKVTSNLDDTTSIYRVNIYDNIYVVQTINLVPTMSAMGDN